MQRLPRQGQRPNPGPPVTGGPSRTPAPYEQQVPARSPAPTLTPARVIVGATGALVVCAATGINAPFIIALALLRGAGEFLLWSWTNYPVRVVLVVVSLYVGWLMLGAVRRTNSSTSAPNPFEQFEEREPYGSASLADRTALGEALQGNMADLGPKFPD